jgi:hypothetical protein
MVSATAVPRFWHLAGRMTILAIRDIRGVGGALADSNGIFMGF